MKLTILILLITASLKAPSYPAIVIPAGEVINGYEAIWKAICQVESSGNQFAIGDKHLKEKSYGIAQIRQVRLDDYYNQSGIRYSVTDMFCPEKSKEVFLWYASRYNVNQIEAISRAWNGGEKGMNKPVTKKYYLKVKSIL
jgi:hypothetical protein